jgi:hypothetical protein
MTLCRETFICLFVLSDLVSWFLRLGRNNPRSHAECTNKTIHFVCFRGSPYLAWQSLDTGDQLRPRLNEELTEEILFDNSYGETYLSRESNWSTFLRKQARNFLFCEAGFTAMQVPWGRNICSSIRRSADILSASGQSPLSLCAKSNVVRVRAARSGGQDVRAPLIRRLPN